MYYDFKSSYRITFRQQKNKFSCLKVREQNENLGTQIPATVKEACCEEALALLERGNNQRRKLQQEGVQSFSLGNMSETYITGAGKGLLSQEAKELLQPWLIGTVNIT